MGLTVEVRVNDDVVAEGHAVNTGIKSESGRHVYDYHVWNDGDVSRSGKIRHRRTDGAAALASKLMERVELLRD